MKQEGLSKLAAPIDIMLAYASHNSNVGYGMDVLQALSIALGRSGCAGLNCRKSTSSSTNLVSHVTRGLRKLLSSCVHVPFQLVPWNLCTMFLDMLAMLECRCKHRITATAKPLASFITGVHTHGVT